MPLSMLLRYAKMLPRLIAERQLLAAEVSAYPHLEEASRRRLLRAWQQASGQAEAVRPSLAGLALIGIGVHVVKAGENG